MNEWMNLRDLSDAVTVKLLPPAGALYNNY